MSALKKVVSLALVLSATLGLSSDAMAQRTPITPADLVKAKDVWTGKLTQKGAFKGIVGVPMEFDCTFTVTESNGKVFKADLTETQAGGISLTYAVTGKITAPTDAVAGSFTIEWTVDSVKAATGTPALAREMTYNATLTNEKISNGTWKLVNPGEDTLQGTFDWVKK